MEYDYLIEDRGHFVENYNDSEQYNVSTFVSESISLIFFDKVSKSLSIKFSQTSDTTYIYKILDIEKLVNILSIFRDKNKIDNMSIGRLINNLISHDNIIIRVGRSYVYNNIKDINSLKKAINKLHIKGKFNSTKK